MQPQGSRVLAVQGSEWYHTRREWDRGCCLVLLAGKNEALDSTKIHGGVQGALPQP